LAATGGESIQLSPEAGEAHDLVAALGPDSLLIFNCRKLRSKQIGSGGGWSPDLARVHRSDQAMGLQLYINRSAIKQISEPPPAGEWKQSANCEGMGVQSRRTVSSSVAGARVPQLP